jgi:hypothetical protein
MVMLIRTLLISVILLSAACSSTTIKDINEFSPRPMAKSKVMPTEDELNSQPFRVVVFAINDESVQLARNSQVGASVTGELIAQISKANANIIGNAGLSHLKSAIEKNTVLNSNNVAADFAITGSISVANYAKKYNKASSYKDKEGKVHVTEASCSHNSLIQGNIYIHNLKTMELIKTVAISGGDIRTTELPGKYYKSCNNLSKTEISSMLRAGGTKAISREDVVFKNLFRPNGYVLERRSNGKVSIFKVTIGQKNGIEQDQNAEFFSTEKNKHPITGKMSETQNKVADGTVTNKIQSKNSWVMIDDENIASQVRLGDAVKISYEKSIFGKIFNHSYSQ